MPVYASVIIDGTQKGSSNGMFPLKNKENTVQIYLENSTKRICVTHDGLYGFSCARFGNRGMLLLFFWLKFLQLGTVPTLAFERDRNSGLSMRDFKEILYEKPYWVMYLTRNSVNFVSVDQCVEHVVFQRECTSRCCPVEVFGKVFVRFLPSKENSTKF